MKCNRWFLAVPQSPTILQESGNTNLIWIDFRTNINKFLSPVHTKNVFLILHFKYDLNVEKISLFLYRSVWKMCPNAYLWPSIKSSEVSSEFLLFFMRINLYMRKRWWIELRREPTPKSQFILPHSPQRHKPSKNTCAVLLVRSFVMASIETIGNGK